MAAEVGNICDRILGDAPPKWHTSLISSHRVIAATNSARRETPFLRQMGKKHAKAYTVKLLECEAHFRICEDTSPRHKQVVCGTAGFVCAVLLNADPIFRSDNPNYENVYVTCVAPKAQDYEAVHHV